MATTAMATMATVDTARSTRQCYPSVAYSENLRRERNGPCSGERDRLERRRVELPKRPPAAALARCRQLPAAAVALDDAERLESQGFSVRPARRSRRRPGCSSGRLSSWKHRASCADGRASIRRVASSSSSLRPRISRAGAADLRHASVSSFRSQPQWRED